jgi:hypothetical protein
LWSPGNARNIQPDASLPVFGFFTGSGILQDSIVNLIQVLLDENQLVILQVIYGTRFNIMIAIL